MRKSLNMNIISIDLMKGKIGTIVMADIYFNKNTTVLRIFPNM